MKLKLIFCISFVLLASFSIYFTFSHFFPTRLTVAERDFYESDLGNGRKIFIVGSSHVGQLNATHIQEILDSYGYSFKIYNLAYQADTPEKRVKTVDKIIGLKPEMVVYGFSYRDLDVTSENIILPEPKQYFHDIASNIDFKAYNPKLLTLEYIRGLFSDSPLFPSTKVITINNTPFFTYDVNTQIQILNQNELKNQAAISEAPKINLGEPSTNKQVRALIELVNKLKNNNINVVLFTTPLNSVYLDGLDSSQKSTFREIQDKITEETGITIHDLTDRYSNMRIWANISHVAFNINSLVYTNDIATIIENEIDS